MLFIGQNAPAPDFSAAGVRSQALIEAFVEWGDYSVAFAAQAKPAAAAGGNGGYELHRIAPNREEETVRLLRDLKPDIVVFDRYIAEEAFSFRVRDTLPDALLVLDMQDCCFLREGRREALQRSVAQGGGEGAHLAAAIGHQPSAGDVRVCRELSSVHRCDLALVCSSVEERLLRLMGVPASKLVYAPFYVDKGRVRRRASASPAFGSRLGFCTIGTMKHAPNVDAVDWMLNSVWPLLRAQLDGASMTVYGAHMTDHLKRRFHRPDVGFYMHGWLEASQLLPALERHRALVAPLRFGAGLKGKIVDGWLAGLPCVTTSIGAEGMAGGGSFVGGVSADDAESFAAACAAVHEDDEAWESQRAAGFRALEAFDREVHLGRIREAIDGALLNLGQRRGGDWTQALLWHEGARSTEYFSRWIELKEKRQL